MKISNRKQNDFPWSSLIFGILLGITLSTVHFFVGILVKQTLQKDLENDISNQVTIGIILSTLSSIVSYYISMELRVRYFKKRMVFRHPLIDVLGILFGAFFVILLNYFITFISKKIYS